MEWFNQKTSIAGIQVSNWMIALGAIIVILLAYSFMRSLGPIQNRPLRFSNPATGLGKQACRSRKFHPARIRALRQNQRIILRNARIPSAAWEFWRQPVQVAAPA
jgi:hypothetical protein